jgi:predicted dehydrogenase
VGVPPSEGAVCEPKCRFGGDKRPVLLEKWGMSFKIGIVGAGGIGGIDAAIFVKDPGVQRHSFFDLEAALAQGIASRFGGQVARSLGELLQQCNAVFVCSEHHA